MLRHSCFVSTFILLLISSSVYSQTDKTSNDKNVASCNDLWLDAVKAFETDFDSTAQFLKLAIPCFKSYEDWENYIKCLNALSTVYYYQNKFEDFKNSSFFTMEEAERYLGPDNPQLADAINNLNSYYFKIGNWDKAINLVTTSLKIKEKNKASKLELAFPYHNLGTLYRLKGDVNSAINYLDKALEYTLDSLPEDDVQVVGLYVAITRCYQQAEQKDSALFYHNKSLINLEKRLSNKKNKFYNFSYRHTVESLQAVTKIWLSEGNIDKAKYYIQKALKLQKEEDAYQKPDSYELLSQIYVEEKKYKEALVFLEKAEEISTKFSSRNTPPLLALRYDQFAKIYTYLGDQDKAISAYQKALKALSPGFESLDYNDNPKNDQLLDKLSALSILHGKAQFLKDIYNNQNKKEAYLTGAYTTYKNATDLIRNIRQGILTVESKKTLSERTISIYEGAIHSALELYQLTGDDQYKASALSLAESNKALLLLESLNEQSAKGFAGIPDSLLEQEKELKLNLAFLQNELLNNKASGGATKNYEDQIFDLNQKLDRLSSDFEKDYPRYFDLKYQNEPIVLKTIQQELAKSNNALLEYFVGAEAIYLFVVTANIFEVQTIDDPPLVYDAIRQLRPILNNPPGTNPQADFAQFSSATHSLYTLLVKQALEQIPESINSLTIIPDDQLNYIPFSILLTEVADKNQPSYTMADLAYLMEQYPINYHYSATLLHKSQQRNKQTYEYDFIGFAPSFKETNRIASRACTADELYSLQCSGEEVASICKLLGGVSHSGAQATKSIFEKEAAAYRIIHLATHACVDESNSNLNKIFLTDDYLSSFDLYNMELNSELAVLSACNTGSGELVKGEGVMNMARGFINAGCSSTLMSMWSVDDCATSDIMLRFYEGLKKGLKKDEALRAAKLSYLQSVSKTKMHPYYWAAFVPFGDMAVMDIGERSKLLFYLIPLGLLLLLFLFYKRRK